MFGRPDRKLRGVYPGSHEPSRQCPDSRTRPHGRLAMYVRPLEKGVLASRLCPEAALEELEENRL
jgi:hypothetical protein